MFYHSIWIRKHFVGVLSEVNVQCIGNNFVGRKKDFALRAFCDIAIMQMAQSLVILLESITVDPTLLWPEKLKTIMLALAVQSNKDMAFIINKFGC